MTDTQTINLRRRLAEALLADVKRAVLPQRLAPGQIGSLEARTHYDLADAALTVVQPELDRLRAELATAKAAGYRQAADNAAEQVQLHGRDADAEMLLVFLKHGAELREQFATNQATLSTTWPVRACGCPSRFDRHADGCTAPSTVES